MKRWINVFVVLTFLTVPVTRLSAQSLFAALTGVVSDPTGAVVPNASVKLINEQTASTRDTVTDGAGYYSFASVSIGDFTYKLVVEAQGFQTYEATGMQILGGEKRNLNVELKVGSATQTVEVTGAVTNIVPVDSGEKSETLTELNWAKLLRLAATPPSISRSCRDSASRTALEQRGQLHRRSDRHQRQWRRRQPEPTEQCLYLTTGCPATRWTSRRTARTFPIRAATAIRPVNPNSDMVSEFKVLAVEFQR